MQAFYRKQRIFALLPRTRSFEIPNSVVFKLCHESAKVLKLLHADSRITVPEEKHKGWIAFEMRDATDLGDALKWFDLAYRNRRSGNSRKR